MHKSVKSWTQNPGKCCEKYKTKTMQICSTNTQNVTQKYCKDHEDIMKNQSQIGPQFFKNQLNSVLGPVWDVFGAISLPCRLQDAPGTNAG